MAGTTWHSSGDGQRPIPDGRSDIEPLFASISFSTVASTVAGQQIASVSVDSYGWFRLPLRPVSPLRLSGIAVLVAGIALIKLP
jgi:putative inner membrane exporter YdcZ